MKSIKNLQCFYSIHTFTQPRFAIDGNSGNTTVGGTLTVGYTDNEFIVDASNGNTTVGGTLSSKPGLIEALEILVISKNRTTDCINNPAQIISTANEYAAGGLQFGILDMLKEDGLPIHNLYEEIIKILTNQTGKFSEASYK